MLNSIRHFFGIGQERVSKILNLSLIVFNSIGLYDLDLGVKDLHNEGLKMVAMGDMDNDKHIDIVTLNDD